ncbi:MAG: hypothetical protein JWN04_1643 [Myxococcaceae bacterium]|nr:hypothetical protein [Myxococcaceae bacterium]
MISLHRTAAATFRRASSLGFSRVHLIAGALSLATALASSLAQAEACPATRLSANNGSPFASCGPVPAAPVQATTPAPGATCPLASDSRVRDIVINSVAINNKPMKARLILPKNYDAQPGKLWPVLYLLTGHGASYESWTCATNVRTFVDNLDVLVVMPEGTVGIKQDAAAYTPDNLAGLGNKASGVPTWYSDWQSDLVQIANSSVYGPRVRMRIMTHHTQELRDVLNKNFRADNGKYAVAGLSMGGFGATAYALSSTPDRPWIAAAAFSGLLDTEYLSANIPYVGGADIPTVIRGSIEVAQAAQGEILLTGNRLWGEKTSATWQANNVKRRVAGGTSRLATIPYYVSTGQGNTESDIDLVARYNDGTLDAAEVAVYFAAQSFLGSLHRSDANFKLEYFPKGGHKWSNWNVNVCRALNLTLVKALDATQTPYPLASCPTL